MVLVPGWSLGSEVLDYRACCDKWKRNSSRTFSHPARVPKVSTFCKICCPGSVSHFPGCSSFFIKDADPLLTFGIWMKNQFTEQWESSRINSVGISPIQWLHLWWETDFRSEGRVANESLELHCFSEGPFSTPLHSCLEFSANGPSNSLNFIV